MYSNKIFEIFKNLNYAGGLQGSNGIGKYIDEECGDFVKIYLIINEKQIITEAQFKTMGSTGAIVASNAVCGLVIGLSLQEARNLKAGDILEVTGEYPANKLYTVDFAIKGLNLAIDDYFERIEKEIKGKRKKSKKSDKQETENISVVEQKQIESVFDVDDAQQLSDKEDAKIQEQETKEQNIKLTQEEQFSESSFEVSSQTYIDDEEESDVPLLYADTPNEELFSDQMPQKESPNLFEKYFADYEREIIEGNKASKYLQDTMSYTPVVETKIIRDEDLPKESAKKQTKNSVSSAKAMFDAMFEE